jgi:hypothetical protein
MRTKIELTVFNNLDLKGALVTVEGKLGVDVVTIVVDRLGDGPIKIELSSAELCIAAQRIGMDVENKMTIPKGFPK